MAHMHIAGLLTGSLYCATDSEEVDSEELGRRCLVRA